MNTCLIRAALVAGLAAPAAYAQDNKDGWMGPCQAELKKFCNGHSRGSSLVVCMKEHWSELSPKCNKALTVMNASKPTGVQQDCQKETERFCKNMKPDGERIMKCLQKREKDLLGKCRDLVANKSKWDRWEKRKKDGWPVACHEDADKLCKDMAPGGDLDKCLLEHQKDLSPKCLRLITKPS